MRRPETKSPLQLIRYQTNGMTFGGYFYWSLLAGQQEFWVPEDPTVLIFFIYFFPLFLSLLSFLLSLPPFLPLFFFLYELLNSLGTYKFGDIPREKPLHCVYLKILVFLEKSSLLRAAIHSHVEWNKGKVLSLCILPIPLFPRTLSGLYNLKAGVLSIRKL